MCNASKAANNVPFCLAVEKTHFKTSLKFRRHPSISLCSKFSKIYEVTEIRKSTWAEVQLLSNDCRPPGPQNDVASSIYKLDQNFASFCHQLCKSRNIWMIQNTKKYEKTLKSLNKVPVASKFSKKIG